VPSSNRTEGWGGKTGSSGAGTAETLSLSILQHKRGKTRSRVDQAGQGSELPIAAVLVLNKAPRVQHRELRLQRCRSETKVLEQEDLAEEKKQRLRTKQSDKRS